MKDDDLRAARERLVDFQASRLAHLDAGEKFYGLAVAKCRNSALVHRARGRANARVIRRTSVTSIYEIARSHQIRPVATQKSTSVLESNAYDCCRDVGLW